MANIHYPYISIIGAGPAGTTAALALARKGIECTLIDKHHFPREKICGDGLGGKVASTLARLSPEYLRDLETGEFATGSDAVRFFSPSVKMMELSFKPLNQEHASGFVCRRFDFDRFLLDKASNHEKIKLIQGAEIAKVARNNGKISLEDKNGTRITDSSLVLFAAGMNKALLEQLDSSASLPALEGIGVRAYFSNVSGTDQKHAIEIHFLEELLPWYLWIFPFDDGSANVGLALPENLARLKDFSLKELLLHLINKYPHLKTRFAGATMQGKIEAQRIPYFNSAYPISGDNYMLLGDAARLVDPFTGEGIGNAMFSGMKAAECAEKCINSGDFSKISTKNYEETVYSKLGPELKLSLKLQKLARNKHLLNLVIGRASRNEKLRNKISEMLYSHDAKVKLSNPLFYIKLLMGT